MEPHAYTMKNSYSLDKPLPVNSFDLPRNFRVQFLDKMKPLKTVLSHSLTSPSKSLCVSDLEPKTFHTHRKLLMHYYFEEPLLFPQIQSYNEQNSKRIHDSYTSELITNDL